MVAPPRVAPVLEPARYPSLGGRVLQSGGPKGGKGPQRHVLQVDLRGDRHAAVADVGAAGDEEAAFVQEGVDVEIRHACERTGPPPSGRHPRLAYAHVDWRDAAKSDCRVAQRDAVERERPAGRQLGGRVEPLDALERPTAGMQALAVDP